MYLSAHFNKLSHLLNAEYNSIEILLLCECCSSANCYSSMITYSGRVQWQSLWRVVSIWYSLSSVTHEQISSMLLLDPKDLKTLDILACIMSPMPSKESLTPKKNCLRKTLNHEVQKTNCAKLLYQIDTIPPVVVSMILSTHFQEDQSSPVFRILKR